MDLDPRDLTAGDIMTESLVIVPENCDVYEAISMMRKGGVRRMPVVNADGALTGIVSLDDLLPLVAQELADLARLPLVGRKREFAYRH
jgi:predicted transcriptional regulator